MHLQMPDTETVNFSCRTRPCSTREWLCSKFIVHGSTLAVLALTLLVVTEPHARFSHRCVCSGVHPTLPAS